jgi:hypothetical protein
MEQANDKLKYTCGKFAYESIAQEDFTKTVERFIGVFEASPRNLEWYSAGYYEPRERVEIIWQINKKDKAPMFEYTCRQFKTKSNGRSVKPTFQAIGTGTDKRTLIRDTLYAHEELPEDCKMQNNIPKQKEAVEETTEETPEELVSKYLVDVKEAAISGKLTDRHLLHAKYKKIITRKEIERDLASEGDSTAKYRKAIQDAAASGDLTRRHVIKAQFRDIKEKEIMRDLNEEIARINSVIEIPFPNTKWFYEFSQEQLNELKQWGLIMYGDPRTGKTSFMKFLLNRLGLTPYYEVTGTGVKAYDGFNPKLHKAIFIDEPESLLTMTKDGKCPNEDFFKNMFDNFRHPLVLETKYSAKPICLGRVPFFIVGNTNLLKVLERGNSKKNPIDVSKGSALYMRIRAKQWHVKGPLCKEVVEYQNKVFQPPKRVIGVEEKKRDRNEGEEKGEEEEEEERQSKKKR